ncbi:uncharacterized protein APUU_10032A [Aspergillus puulaauensis]|uniref:Uncharacterized protein n=1 Tax=Aspergillus puulaauensis TaxID=1220207 RepID=A0A7R7XAR1_9EURO|nr:uncharacterized protein APUU_10032A [Aspergillus puulaauensis]BCS17204.1 hypothetical protein APUU_10032A [Aspergillus puulaauensis]
MSAAEHATTVAIQHSAYRLWLAFELPNYANDLTPGPLLTVALALFGPGSLPDRLMRALNLYTNLPLFARPRLCVDRVPFGGLIPSVYGLIFSNLYTSQLLSRTNRCITDDNKANSMDIMVSWPANFNAQPEVIQNVFAAAAFLASQAWMLDNREGDLQFIRLDPGTTLHSQCFGSIMYCRTGMEYKNIE